MNLHLQLVRYLRCCKNYLIPVYNYREDLQWLPYAEEADLLNVALFGFTAKAWRDANPELAKKQG
ncbi:MAG: hypothetical protein ACI39H_03220 [Lachnospiraceae bacterium]